MRYDHKVAGCICHPEWVRNEISPAKRFFWDFAREQHEEQVIEHTGPSYTSRVPNPVRSELYPAGDDTFRAFFFYIGTGLAYGILDSDLTPVVFKNEGLEGWGWLYWEGTATQYNIRIRSP